MSEDPTIRPSPQLSLVVPMYNEAASVDVLYERCAKVLDGIGLPWEIVAIDDGSRDGTEAAVRALHNRDPRVKLVSLSRNFGKEVALTAGLDFAQGDLVIPFDADLQDPPEVIPALVAKWREGFDVVLATRSRRDSDSLVKRTSARWFYRVIQSLSRVQIPADTGDFRLMTRPVLEAVRRMREHHRFMKGIFAWVGFRQAVVHYERAPRQAGHTKWSYWKLWNLAIEGITSFTQVPLQLAMVLGLLTAMLAFFYGIVFFIGTLFYGNPVPGYPSLLVVTLFLGGVQLTTIGILGEYVGRIYNEAKRRPLYFVREVVGLEPPALLPPEPNSGHPR